MLTYLVCETLSFAGQVIAGAPSEMFGGLAQALTSGKYRQIRDRLDELGADANHDLQRAIHAAYWQSISLVCSMRAEQVGFNTDSFFIRNKTADVFTGWLEQLSADAPLNITGDTQATEFASAPRVWEKLTRWFKQQPRHRALQSLATSEEVDWLAKALRGCWERSAQVRSRDWQPPDNGTDQHFETLLLHPQPDHADYLATLREFLTGQMEDDVALAFKEPPTLLDGSCPLRDLLQKHWYELFRGCFHAAIKSDPKVFAISQSQMLAELVCRAQPQGNGAALTVAQLTSALETLNQQLRPQFEQVLQTIAQKPRADAKPRAQKAPPSNKVSGKLNNASANKSKPCKQSWFGKARRR